MDSLTVDELGSAVVVIQQIGLGVNSVVFLPEAVAFHASLNRSKDLQGDKEGCAMDVVGKRDCYIAPLIVSYT